MIVSAPIVELDEAVFSAADIRVRMLRLDKLNTSVKGNKYFKLKYNLEFARDSGFKTLLSFGGAYSNHIKALALAGKEYGFKTIGIIRGEELSVNSNEMLRFAKQCGMQLEFVDRETYRRKNEPEFQDGLQSKFGPVYIIPEGGSNELAVKGCKEIVDLIPGKFTHIIAASGTAGTLCGIWKGISNEQTAIGITVVNAENYFEEQVRNLLNRHDTPANLKLTHRFHFGGYNKSGDKLSEFRNVFYEKQGVMPDLQYNAKAIFALYELAREGFFPAGSKLVFIYTASD